MRYALLGLEPLITSTTMTGSPCPLHPQDQESRAYVTHHLELANALVTLPGLGPQPLWLRPLSRNRPPVGSAIAGSDDGDPSRRNRETRLCGVPGWTLKVLGRLRNRLPGPVTIRTSPSWNPTPQMCFQVALNPQLSLRHRRCSGREVQGESHPRAEGRHTSRMALTAPISI